MGKYDLDENGDRAHVPSTREYEYTEIGKPLTIAQQIELKEKEYDQSVVDDYTRGSTVKQHQMGALLLLRALRSERDSDELISTLEYPWVDLVKPVRDFYVPDWEDRYQKRRNRLLDLLYADVEFAHGQVKSGYSQVIIRFVYDLLDATEARGDISLPDPHPSVDPLGGNLIESHDFFSTDYKADWLIEGILAHGSLAVLGGPIKCLKTTLLIEMCISVASGTPFLGRWQVPGPFRVGLISAEDPFSTTQATAKDICRAKGIEDPGTLNLVWGRTLPYLDNPRHVERIASFASSRGLDLIAIDPLYLAMSSNIGDVNSMYRMGEVLSGFAAAMLHVGTTPLLVHHSPKNSVRGFAPLDVHDLAHAGVGQIARQWIMVSRREEFLRNTRTHRLHLAFGGSGSKSGLFDLDINLRSLTDDEEQGWNVTVAEPQPKLSVRTGSRARNQPASPEPAAQVPAGAEAKVDPKELEEQQAMREAVEAFRAAGGKLSTKGLRDSTHNGKTTWNKGKADRIIARLVAEGRLKAAQGGQGRGSSRFELIEGGPV